MCHIYFFLIEHISHLVPVQEEECKSDYNLIYEVIQSSSLSNFLLKLLNYYRSLASGKCHVKAGISNKKRKTINHAFNSPTI